MKQHASWRGSAYFTWNSFTVNMEVAVGMNTDGQDGDASGVCGYSRVVI